ncbi:hypothetical protein D3C80_958810 [compost metagenome]
MRELSISMRICRISGAQGMEAVAAAVTPLLKACTRNHQIGTLAERSPIVLKVVPQAVSVGWATLIPQRWLATSSNVIDERLNGKTGAQPNNTTM